MNKWVLFVMLSALLCLISSDATAQTPTTSDTLVDASIMRPIDTFMEDIRWNKASADLYTYWIDNGLYGFYGPQPEILLDDIPVDANFFGWQNLNLLPITDSHSRNYDLAPQVYQHNLSPAGFVNFGGQPLASGLSASASYYVGNETGDPGPYIYNSMTATPNIDRWGPDGEFALSYKNQSWYAKARFVFRNHFPTDIASNARLHFTASLLGTNTAYVNHQVFAESKSGLLETGYLTDSWGVRGRAVYGMGRDYIFLQPLGREVPAKPGYKQIAADAYYKAGNFRFDGRYIRHQKTINKRIDLHPYIFNWDQRKHSFAFSTTYRTDNIKLKPGIKYERLKTSAPGIVQPYNDLVLTSLKGELQLSNYSLLKTEISVDYDEEQTAQTYQLSIPTTLTSFWTMTPQIISSQTLPLRQHSFGYWVNRGYTFANELGITFSESVNVKKNELTLAKLKNTIDIFSNISIVLEQKLVEHHSLNVPWQRVVENEFITDTQPGLFFVTQEEGSRLTIFGQINHSINNLLSQSLSINSQHTVSGSARYESYFQQVPEMKVQYQIDLQPVESLVLSVNALYRSSTKWSEFKAIDGNQYRLPGGIPIQVTQTFDTQTPAFLDIGLSIQKWFWGDRLNTKFSLNNLLNNELRMHPLGADLNTIFDLKVSLNF